MNDKIYPTMVIRSQAEAIELLKKENEKLNNDIKILLKENENKEKVILKYDNIIKELDNYIESDEFNNTFHCCEERNKVKKDIIKILKGSDKE